MDNEKLDALLGWCFDTAQLRAKTYAAALKAGIDVGDVVEFFNPTIFMEALAGHELKVGYYDFDGDTKGEFLLWAKDVMGTEPETEPAQIPTQPPEFKLPYGWIELHQGEHYPFYVKTSDVAAIEPMSSANFHAKVYYSGCSRCIPCTETTEEILKKVTKSYPSISERFGGCI